MGGLGAAIADEWATNSCTSSIASAWFVSFSEPIVEIRSALMPRPAERASGVAGIDLGLVRKLQKPPQ